MLQCMAWQNIGDKTYASNMGVHVSLQILSSSCICAQAHKHTRGSICSDSRMLVQYNILSTQLDNDHVIRV